MTAHLPPFFPYQARIFRDPARFIAACMARQTGKSFTVAAKIAADLAARPAGMWLIAAPSDRQSLEALAKVRQWVQALGIAAADGIPDLRDPSLCAGSITLANSSRCIAVPGRPDTVRGFSCNVWMDEFAFFDDPDATWRAILPSISNPLRGGEKRVIITSTPNGIGGRGKRFCDIIQGRSGTWSTHLVTLPQAIAEGLPVDYAAIAAALDDPNAEAQELNCAFIDTAGALLPYELITAAEDAEASMEAPPGLYDGGRTLFGGFDFGRSGDPSAWFCFEDTGGRWVQREALYLRDAPTGEQAELMRPRFAACARVAVDYTGPGIGFGDILGAALGIYDPKAHRYGPVQLCTFSAPFKQRIFPELRRALEERLRIARHHALREDLHAMQQVFSGHYSYESRRSKAGHADMCCAAALAVHAAADPVASPHFGTIGRVPLGRPLPPPPTMAYRPRR